MKTDKTTKNLLKICAFCLLILSPPAQAQQHDGEMSGGELLVGGGVITMISGAVVWATSESPNRTCNIVNNVVRCTTAADDGKEALGQNMVAVGAGAMVVGAIAIGADDESAFRTRWRFHAADGVPKAVYPLSENTHFSFGMSGKSLDYDGVAIGLKYSF